MKRSRMTAWGGSLDRTDDVRSDNAPAFVYYDASVTNESTTTSIPDVFRNTSNNAAVVPRARDYSMAVIRFSIPSDSIPLLKQYSVSGSVGTFTTGSTQITQVTNQFGPEQTIRNYAVGMLVASTVVYP